MPEPANNCTIEFHNGRTIHVAHSPQQVRELIFNAYRKVGQGERRQTHRPDFITLTRMGGGGARKQQGWQEIEVNPESINAIFPIQGHSDPATSNPF